MAKPAALPPKENAPKEKREAYGYHPSKTWMTWRKLQETIDILTASQQAGLWDITRYPINVATEISYLPWVYPWFTPHPSEMSSEIDGHREQNNALTCRTSDWLIGYNHWRHKRSLPGGHESKVVPLSTNFSTALYVLGFISSYETNSKCLKKSLLGERPPLKQPIRHAQAHAFQKNLLGKETRMIWSGCWFPILSEKYPMLNCHITNWKITMFNGDFPVCYVTVYQAG